MSQAVYFSSGEVAENMYRHYGLATPIYTHFTSPIRRYADVCVHRLLAASLELEPLPEAYENKADMSALAGNMNTRHYMAQMAGRASVELHTLLFFKNRASTDEAYIIRVQPDKVNVIVPRYGIEGSIYLTPRQGRSEAQQEEAVNSGPFTHDPDAHTLTHKRNAKLNIQIFDRVMVRIFVQELGHFRQKLVLELDSVGDNVPFVMEGAEAKEPAVASSADSGASLVGVERFHGASGATSGGKGKAKSKKSSTPAKEGAKKKKKTAATGSAAKAKPTKPARKATPTSSASKRQKKSRS